MAQVRVTWVEVWTAPTDTASAETTFRLVMTDDDGLEYAIERAYTDAAGGESWELVTYLKDSSVLPADLASAGLTQNVLAAMLGVLFSKRR